MGSHFESILLELNETNSSGPCLETLMAINKEVEWPDNKPNIAILQRSGYMKSLINNLYSSRKDIIDVTLRIFLNCTMDKDFTRDAMGQDLRISLYDLFNLYPEEESMKQIIFKMLGNICKHSGDWIFDQSPNFQTLTLNLLQRFCSTENVCEDTLLAALRFWSERSRLAHLLLQFGCLDSLAQLLKDGSSLKERIVKFFHVLASRRLAIADPTQVDVTEHSQPAILAPPNSDAAEQKLVTFKLDDGSTVQADRNLLSKRTWYFSVLLEGNFKESGEDEVALHNTLIDSLRFMLHLIEDPESVRRLVRERDLDFLFDAMVFIDRYGQSELCGLIASCIKTCQMNSETVAAIYRWSIELGLDLLRMDAVTFALVHCSGDDERVVMFDSLLGCTEELTGDVQTILERYLRPFMRDTFDD